MHINLFDSHTHSDNSPDGRDPITFLCEKAIEKGLTGIAITDHCDINHYQEMQYAKRMRQARFECLVDREIFKTRLILAMGIELGQPMENPQLAAEVLAKQRYDFVLASVHNAPGEMDYAQMDFRTIDPHPVLDRYFEELIKTAEWGQFDSLAHLCYPLRYMSRQGVVPNMSRYEEAHDAVFRALVERGKAVELNTAALRHGGAITPTLAHLKRFKELGGEFVTIGSDAHDAGTVGAGVLDGMAFLDEAGFSHFAFYRGHQPCMLRVV